MGYSSGHENRQTKRGVPDLVAKKTWLNYVPPSGGALDRWFGAPEVASRPSRVISAWANWRTHTLHLGLGPFNTFFLIRKVCHARLIPVRPVHVGFCYHRF